MEDNIAYTPKVFVGRKAPDFVMPSTKNIQTLGEPVKPRTTRQVARCPLYPLGFTFVCPTELRGFSDRYDEFKKEDAEIVGVSIDSPHTHRAWLKAAPDQGGLGELRYPLASDVTHQVSKDYGVFIEESGHSLRGTFVIDPQGVVRLALVHDLDVGRSVEETLRAIRAFKTGGLCPVDWKSGQATLKV